MNPLTRLFFPRLRLPAALAAASLCGLVLACSILPVVVTLTPPAGPLPPTRAPTRAPTGATASPTPGAGEPAGAAAACLPSGAEPQEAEVIQVIDGDTLQVRLAGRRYKVRYIGLDAPEDTTRVEPYGPEATALNRSLVEGQTVTLYRDVSETDRYDRLLRYVFVGDMFVNLELVSQGYADAIRYAPDTSCQEVLAAAEEQARADSLGMWAGTPSQ